MENTFIKYEKALEIIERYAFKIKKEKKSILSCDNRILNENLKADRDFPPYDRVTMDGIAINFSSYENGNRNFKVESTSAAGSPELSLKNPSNCIEIMTGCMLPKNTNTVIRYEDLDITENVAKINDVKLKKWQNIHFKGSDIKQDEVIIESGKVISSAEIIVAASIGKDYLSVVKLPNAIVISTGDELVRIKETPKPFQIRRSNVHGIQNSLKKWGLDAELGHLPDNKIKMKEKIESYLSKFDLLIFTGGVSKGKFDFLPDVLEDLKVKKHFYKIQQRPGKPFWFGSIDDKKIFALPGNPVSSFVCLNIYIKYWINYSIGTSNKKIYVELLNNVKFNPDLVYFPEAKIYYQSNGNITAEVILGNGSGDFVNLVKTDGFLILPQNKSEFKKGEKYEFIPYREF